MTRPPNDYQRYCALRDRQAAGAVLTDEELAFCERMERDDVACRQEVAWLDQLADLDAGSTEASRALVAATMDAVAEGALENEHDREPPEADGHVRSSSAHRRVVRLRWLAALAAAGVAGLCTWWASRTPDAHLASRHEPTTSEASSAPRSGAELEIGTGAIAERRTTPRRVELTYASGQVRINGDPLSPGDALGLAPQADGGQPLLVAVAGGSACLAMDPGIDVCLDSQSALALQPARAGSQRLDLVRGRVAVSLDEQPRGYDLTVRANGVDTTAIGTVFSVVHKDIGEPEVHTNVLEGKVRVTRDGETAVVRAHERHVVNARGRHSTELSRRDESAEWAPLDATRLWQARLTGTLDVVGAAPGAEVRMDGKRLGVVPVSSLVPTGEHRVEIRHPEGESQVVTVVIEPGGHATLRPEPMRPTIQAVEPVREPRSRRTPSRSAKRRQQPAESEVAPSPEQPSATPDALLASARQALLAGDYGAAAGHYRALYEQHPASAEAHTVMVPLAQLELERLHHPEAALALVNAYLLRARGPLRHEAQVTRIGALRALGRTDAEREAIEALLRDHPESFHRGRLRERLQVLAR